MDKLVSSITGREGTRVVGREIRIYDLITQGLIDTLNSVVCNNGGGERERERERWGENV